MITKQTISLEDKVVQGEGNIVSDMGGEKVMLSVQNGKYYNLGEIGGEIWDCIETEIAVKEVVSSLVSMYDVSQGECENQVLSFLEHLYTEKLVQVNK